MLARELITDSIPPLKTSDKGSKALDWMEEFRVSHLPIVNNSQFLGLISEADILDMNNSEQPIGNHSLSLRKPFVFDFQHIYDVIKLVNDQRLSTIPVLDAQENYLGMISIQELVEFFATIGSVQNPGGIIVLEVGIRDYSLTEIARLVESNDAKILSSYITSHPDSTMIEVTLKINNVDLSRIIATFERFNYSIKASFHQDSFLDDMKDRYDSLMNYLNI